MEMAEQNTSDLQAASSRSEPHNKSEDFHYTPRAASQPRTPLIITVEVIIKLQIASTRILFVIPVTRKGIKQGYVAVV